MWILKNYFAYMGWLEHDDKLNSFNPQRLDLITSVVPLMMSFDTLVYADKDVVWRPLEKFLGCCTGRVHPHQRPVILFHKQVWKHSVQQRASRAKDLRVSLCFTLAKNTYGSKFMSMI